MNSRRRGKRTIRALGTRAKSGKAAGRKVGVALACFWLAFGVLLAWSGLVLDLEGQGMAAWRHRMVLAVTTTTISTDVMHTTLRQST